MDKTITLELVKSLIKNKRSFVINWPKEDGKPSASGLFYVPIGQQDNEPKDGKYIPIHEIRAEEQYKKHFEVKKVLQCSSPDIYMDELHVKDLPEGVEIMTIVR